MKHTFLILLVAAALLACGSAQDAGECDDLRLKMTAVEQRLADAQASGTACSTEAEDLRTKLQMLEGSISHSMEEMRKVEKELAEAPTREAGAQLEAAAAAAKDSLAATERQLGEATAKLAASEKELAALKAEVQEAKSAATSCTSREGTLKKAADEAAAKLKAQLSKAREEAERVRSDSAAAQRQLAELERLKAAWLPFWAEEATASVRAAAAPAVQQAVKAAKRVGGQGAQRAQELWQAHGKPGFERAVAVAKEQGAVLNAAIEARAGDSWPKAKAAVGSAYAAARDAAVAAWNSPALAAVRPAAAKAAVAAAAQARSVQGELEGLLISLLAKHNNTAPLARRPYVTYMVYAALLVPAVAVGLPLLGLRRSGSAQVAKSSGGQPMSSKKRSKGKGGKH